jgi:hypothetical protein
MVEQERSDEFEGLLAEAEAIRARLAETLQSAATRGIAAGAFVTHVSRIRRCENDTFRVLAFIHGSSLASTVTSKWAYCTTTFF